MKSALLSLLLSFPLFAAHPLAEPALAPTAYGTHRPTTAFAGTRFLTVWTEMMGSIGRHFKGAFSDANGRPVSPASFTLIRNVNPEWTQLVGTGDGYALFWREQHVTRMTNIDLQGNVTSTRTLDLPSFIGNTAHVAWNGSRFLFVMRHHQSFPMQDAEGFLLERDGDVVRWQIAVEDLSSQYAIVPVENGFVAFSSGIDLVAHRVTNEGAVQQKLIERASGSTAASIRARDVIATSGGNGDVLLAWASGNDLESQLRTAIFTRDGNVSSTNVIRSEQASIVPVALHHTGSGAVLAYAHAATWHAPMTLYTTRLDANGAAIGTPFAGPQIVSPSFASNANVLLIVGSMNDVISVPRVSSIAIGATGALAAPEMLSNSPARQLQPALTAAGGRVLAAWTDLLGDAASLRTAVVAADAQPLQRNVAGASFLAADEVVWNGSEALVVTHANRSLLATRIDANGVAVAPPIVIGSYPHLHYSERRASATWAGDRWIVVWSTQGDIRMVTISRAGVASPERVLPVSPSLPPNMFQSFDAVEIASDGTRVLLVWRETRAPICWFPICGYESDVMAYARRITPDGENVDDAALLVPTLKMADNFSIATSGNEFVVAGGPRAVSIDARGDAPRILASREFFAGASDVTWDGRDYVIAFRYQLYRFYLAVRRIDSMLQDTATARGIETLPPYSVEEPSIAAADSTQTLIALDEGTPESGARAVVYLETELPALVAPPAAPLNVRVQPANGAFDISWDPPSGAVELYQIEALTPNGWIWVAQVPATVRSARSPYRVMRVRAVNAGGYSTFANEETRKRSVRH